MLISEEQKRWLVVGISLHKVLAPRLRSYVANGLKNHYTTLDGKYSLTTLTHDKCVCTCKCRRTRKGQCKDNCTCVCTCGAYADLQHLRYENVHNNALIGKTKADRTNYNYNINNPVDLAKLYLPEYLACFDDFYDSLDLSAMLRLLGTPIFPSPLVSIQAAADDVKDDVRNKWAHCILKDWTPGFYSDCFVTLEKLVESLGLGSADEKQLKDEMKDWQSKGCDMCMGHIVDKDLLQLVQQEVRDLSQQCKDLYQEFPDLKNELDDTMNRLNQMEQEVNKLREKVKSLEEESKKQGKKVDDLEGKMTETQEKMTEVRREVGDMKQRMEGAVPQERKVKEDPPLQKEIMNEYEKRHSWIHPFPWLEHFQLALKDVFTRLKIVSMEKGRYVPSDKTIGMFEVFEPHEYCRRPTRVLVEADPGMGKTTFSEKLCLDWATGENMHPFPLLPLVIFLKCRDLISGDIMEAMVDQLLPKDVSEKDKSALLKYVDENQSDILLLVDGMDELGNEEVDLSDLLQRSILSKIHLLVTTRHEAGISIRQHFDSLFEITGYTIGDAKEYIRKYFEFIKEKEKSEPLLHKIKETFYEDGRAKSKDADYWKELLSNPLRTSLLCAVSEDCGSELPARRTQLYTKISECILRRHFKKENPRTAEIIPEEPLLHYRDELLILGELALQGLAKHQLYFDAKELEGHSPNIAKFGFLSKEAAASKTKPVLKYSFLHKTFQEYLAAFYLCKKFVSGEVTCESFIREHSDNIKESRQVFLFSAGILAGKRATAVIVSLVKSLTRKLATLFVKRKAISGGDINSSFFLLCDCVCECIVGGKLNDEQKDLCAFIGQEIPWEVLVLMEQVGDERGDRWKVLCEVMKNNRMVKRLHLNYNQLTDVTLLVDSLEHNTTLKGLYLRDNPIVDLTALTELKRQNRELLIDTDRGEILSAQ